MCQAGHHAGSLPGSRAGALPVPAAGAGELGSLQGSFRSSTPRQLGRLQNPHDVCWELLQHARRREPSQAPRTTGPASCRGRQDVGLPAAPCLHHCLPAAGTTGSKAPAAASSSVKHTPRGRGAAVEGGTALGSIRTFSGFFSPLALLFVDLSKNYLMQELPPVPSTSLESWSGAKRGGKPSGMAARSQPCCFAGTRLGHAWQPCRAARCPPREEQLRVLRANLLGSRGTGERTAVVCWQLGPITPLHLCFAHPRGAPAWRYPIPTSLHPAGHRQKSIAPHRCNTSSRSCVLVQAPRCEIEMVFSGRRCQQRAFGNIRSAKPYGGGDELTGPCFSAFWGFFFGSGFGFSSSVMVFSLLSLTQSREQGRQPAFPRRGSPACCRSGAGAHCMG